MIFSVLMEIMQIHADKQPQGSWFLTDSGFPARSPLTTNSPEQASPIHAQRKQDRMLGHRYRFNIILRK